MNATHQAQFQTLVKELEDFSRRQPSAYRWRVGLLTALGLAYVGLMVACMIALVWGLRLLATHLGGMAFEQQVNQVTLMLLAGIMGLFWLKYPPPKGIELKRQQVPQLFEAIDELTAQLATPPFHRVLLTDELNAGVLQVPRLGFLGWQTNYLLIGLPLLQAVSPEQFRATLAHEFAHLSGNDSRFAGWIYRVRKAWFLLVKRFHHQGQRSSLLFEPFFNWYEPFFQAYSFVLARSNEYEADRCAADLVGVSQAGEELMNLFIKDAFLKQSFWSKVYKTIRHRPNPPDRVMSELSEQLTTAEIPETEARRWLEMALAATTGYEDTHPCLRDRLQALGYTWTSASPLPLPAPIPLTAGQHYLGTALTELTQKLDQHWKTEQTRSWAERHALAQLRLQTFQRFQEPPSQRSLTPEAAWRQAQLTAEFEGKAAAIPLYKAILAEHPDHPATHFSLGQILLKADRPEGMAYLKRAIGLNPEFAVAGYEQIYDFLYRQGQSELAQNYLQNWQTAKAQWEALREARSTIKVQDPFISPTLPLEERTQLAEQLASFPEITLAYWVQKVLPDIPDCPLSVLGIRCRPNLEKLKSGQPVPALPLILQDILNFSGTVTIVVLDEHNKALWKRFKQIPGSLLYSQS